MPLMINETNRMFINQIKEEEPVKYSQVEGYENIKAQKHKNSFLFDFCFLF